MSFLKTLFRMKQIQGSVRVKINEYVDAWSEFLFVSLLIFISFPKLIIFTILRLFYMACKLWKITALTWKISGWRLVEKFHITAFPMYYSLYNWIGGHEITKLNKKNVCFESRKKGAKTSTKRHDWNGMTQNGYFQQCACVNAIYFAPVVNTTYRMKKNKGSTRGLSLGMSVLARARAQLLNMLYISTHLSVPHGENI